ncbi:MAG: hypothetical protein ABSE96_00560 [Terracidiphilus sp.]|jgi:hypothetical protein
MRPNHRLRSFFRDPVFLLAVAAGLIAFVVQSGELGTADTQHRLNSTHAFWTSEPPVYDWEYPEFGVHGRGGRLQSWYGIGQSLLMLPQDMTGTFLENLPLFAHYKNTDPTVRNIFVSFTTNILVTVLTALVCFRLLRQFGFTISHSVMGVLALLLATTHLHYTQNMMENNYIFLLTVTGFCFEYEWLRTGSRRALLIGTGAFGLNLLTRLTTGIDLLAGTAFALLVLWFDQTPAVQFWNRCRTYAATAIPVFCFFGLLDRLYQFYRFGSFTNTYVSVVAHETLQRHPDWPKMYPFETPFHIGFFGALFTPEKSIFLFDPLLFLAILVAILGWKQFNPAVRAYTIAAGLMLLAYISFYARYTVWSGDDAWGDRYVSTSVELAVMLAFPLLLRYRAEFGKLMWLFGIALLAVSTVIQLASLAFWLPLELYQMEEFGHPTFVIALRMKNIAAFALGKMDAWGLATDSLHEDPWDYVHMTTWNFLPFLLKRVGVAPAWAVRVAFVAWLTGLAALAATLFRLRSVATKFKLQAPSDLP